MAQLILQPGELRMLERLRLNPQRSFPGRIRGERLTKRRGLSIEFSDYREYTAGDDLRHLDWNVLARLDNAIIKTYRDEEDLAVHILVDVSASMGFGEPSKLELARRLGAALGYAGLIGGDGIHLRALGQRQSGGAICRSRASFLRLCGWLNSQKPDSQASMTSGVRDFTSSSARPGLVILLSDGLDPAAAGALRVLAGRGHEVAMIQILSPLDVDPDIEGDLRLVDSETGATVEITANSITMKQYRDRLQEHLDELQRECTRGGGRWAQVRSDETLEQIMKRILIRQGWLAA